MDCPMFEVSEEVVASGEADQEDPAMEVNIPFLEEGENEEHGDEDPNDCSGIEEVVLGKTLIELPRDLYENKNIFDQFFSLETWNDLLSEEVKMGLLNLLPTFPTDDIDEKVKTIEMLFGGANFHFGNPFENFRKDLVNGDYLPDNFSMKTLLRKAQKRNYEHNMEEYHYQLLQEILESRKKLLEKITGCSVSTPLCVLKLERKVVRLGKDMKGKVKKRYLDELSMIRREVGEDVSSSEDEGYPVSPPEKITKTEVNLLQSNLWGSEDNTDGLASKLEPAPEQEEHISGIGILDDALNQNDDSIAETIEPELEADAEDMDTEVALALTQDTHSSFFSLLRDLFMLRDGLLTMPELDRSLSAWQESPIAALNPWYPECSDPAGWRAYIPSAVAFLCASFPEQQPANFCAYLSVDSGQGKYQWIGAGRDSDGNMVALTSWWLPRRESCRAGFVSQAASGQSSADVPPGNVTQWQVRQSSAVEREAYRQQEAQRYSAPHLPFQWSMHGYTATVGPVKGAAGVRPKNHSMLVTDRPPAVTILTLVRDAVSRLPNGEGTRSDIVDLLLDSQYLVAGSDMGSLTTTVSGALDRLQNDEDACVKYDNNRKIWIYLHRARSLQDFVRMSVEQQQGHKQAKVRQRRRKSDIIAGQQMSVIGVQQQQSQQIISVQQQQQAQQIIQQQPQSQQSVDGKQQQQQKHVTGGPQQQQTQNISGVQQQPQSQQIISVEQQQLSHIISGQQQQMQQLIDEQQQTQQVTGGHQPKSEQMISAQSKPAQHVIGVQQAEQIIQQQQQTQQLIGVQQQQKTQQNVCIQKQQQLQQIIGVQQQQQLVGMQQPVQPLSLLAGLKPDLRVLSPTSQSKILSSGTLDLGSPVTPISQLLESPRPSISQLLDSPRTPIGELQTQDLLAQQVPIPRREALRSDPGQSILETALAGVGFEVPKSSWLTPTSLPPANLLGNLSPVTNLSNLDLSGLKPIPQKLTPGKSADQELPTKQITPKRQVILERLPSNQDSSSRSSSVMISRSVPSTLVNTTTTASTSTPIPHTGVQTGRLAGTTGKSVQRIIVKGADGKVIPLSAATLQKLVAVGAIKPGLQIATPDLGKDGGQSLGEAGGSVRVVRQVSQKAGPGGGMGTTGQAVQIGQSGARQTVNLTGQGLSLSQAQTVNVGGQNVRIVQQNKASGGPTVRLVQQGPGRPAAPLILSTEQLRNAAPQLVLSGDQVRNAPPQLVLSGDQVRNAAPQMVLSGDQVRALAPQMLVTGSQVKGSATQLVWSGNQMRTSVQQKLGNQVKTSVSVIPAHQLRTSSLQMVSSANQIRTAAPRIVISEEQIRTSAPQMASAGDQIRTSATQRFLSGDQFRTSASQRLLSGDQFRISASQIVMSGGQIRPSTSQKIVTGDQMRTSIPQMVFSGTSVPQLVLSGNQFRTSVTQQPSLGEYQARTQIPQLVLSSNHGGAQSTRLTLTSDQLRKMAPQLVMSGDQLRSGTSQLVLTTEQILQLQKHQLMQYPPT